MTELEARIDKLEGDVALLMRLCSDMEVAVRNLQTEHEDLDTEVISMIRSLSVTIEKMGRDYLKSADEITLLNKTLHDVTSSNVTNDAN